jgi:6-phosphogluconate dehydrogenase
MDNKIGTPVLSSSLNYFDMFSTGRSGSNLIQAQRDFFGAHTYERIDKEGNFHTDWN